MRLKDYMFKKRYFGDIFLLSVDKDKLIKELRDNKRFVVYSKENDDRIVVYDTFQNYDIDFIGVVSSIENGTEINGYFSHKVPLLEWIGYFFVSTLWWIWFFRNFTFSISNILGIVIGVLLMLFLFAMMPMTSFVSCMRISFISKWFGDNAIKKQ